MGACSSVSLMVTDLISVDYGWLWLPDGVEEVQVYFKAGKVRNGYFTNSNITEHTMKAMDILSKHFPYNRHIFVFGNAKTRIKHPDDALSAQKMPKYPSKSNGPSNFGVLWDKLGANGKPVYGADRKVVREKVRMVNVMFDGHSQSLYFANGEDPDNKAGVFKGMQCWGKAKHTYQDLPPSSKEAALEQNVKTALASVLVQSIQQFSTWAQHLMDAYWKGLSGKQASWAAKRYHGHCRLPDSILEQLDEHHIE
ncbi:hypothetical protein HETIRDRAFT_322092 [Heterobasidion irregulare TC 32-1]|uniref:Uncharacterized protein n=1 Tax=Heterobasidion irregulare (strain TC 32-1) TaxID=747525 RepID=W4K2B6_HETIT|nr:uncharacterized protein HETIRDRAFT_322092 [Heterobasidion irregulare TC 32-1]ETW79490.1 hypothetical protein HETIRDRAFT_322092 [Heterobasidion irregulare TC 32-1]